jgi:hypothetical protein
LEETVSRDLRQFLFTVVVAGLLFAGLAFCHLGCANVAGERRLVAGEVTTMAGTGSMRPALVGGETIRIVAVPFNQLKVGQIVVRYDSAKQLNICHRIIARVESWSGGIGYRLKGDANMERDVKVMTADEYVGVVTVEKGATK